MLDVPRAATTPMRSTPSPNRSAGATSSNFLAADEHPVGDIVDALDLAQPSVSKHLRVLLDVGLVRVRPRRPAGVLSHERRRASGRCTSGPSTFERYWRHQLTRVKERAEQQRNDALIRHHDRGGTMTAVAPALEHLSLNLTQEILVRSSLVDPFAALLEEMGPANEGHNGSADADGPRSRGPAAAGSAISATTTGTSGVTCRRSSRRRCSRSPGR